MIRLLIAFVLLPTIVFAVNPEKKLIIYSTKSFAYIWKEDNSALKNQFEEKCSCKIEFHSFDGANTIISRLIIEGENSPADLIMGIDNNFKDKILDLNLIAAHHIDESKLSLPVAWHDSYFIPYDYGYLSFIYNSKSFSNPPKSFKELAANPKIKIIIQDPRSSSLGMGLIAWIKLLYQDQSVDLWKALKNNIVTVTKSWSDSYNLFSKGEADMMLSYSSSPIYNIIHKNHDDIKAAQFDEGHFLQIDLMAKLKSSKNQELADLFIDFILSADFQQKLAVANCMYPVVDTILPKAYSSIFTPSKVIIAPDEQIKKDRNLWVQEWLGSLINK